MAKFKIAAEPTFTIDVSIPRVAGDDIVVPFTFKYRDRTQLAALYDGWREKGAELSKRFAESSPTVVEVTGAQMDLQVEQIQDLVESWGFDDELSVENIRALVLTSAGAPDAVISAYGEAFAKARQGN